MELSGTEFVQACAALQDDLLNGRIRHLDQPALNSAVTGADIRTVGEAWAFSARASSVDISPLEAITLAASQCRNPVGAVEASFVSLDDYLDEEE